MRGEGPRSGAHRARDASPEHHRAPAAIVARVDRSTAAACADISAGVGAGALVSLAPDDRGRGPASAVGAASGALLVARVLPLQPSSMLSVLTMEVQATWMLATNRRLLAQPGYPRALGRLGVLIGAWTLGGGVLAGLGPLFPAASAPRRALLVAGGVPGIAAWAAWPAWLNLAARHLRRIP